MGCTCSQPDAEPGAAGTKQHAGVSKRHLKLIRRAQALTAKELATGPFVTQAHIDAMVRKSTAQSAYPFPTIQGSTLICKGDAKLFSQSLYNSAALPFDLPAGLTAETYNRIVHTVNQSAAQSLLGWTCRVSSRTVQPRAKHALKAVEQTLLQLNNEYDGVLKLTQHVEAVDRNDLLSQKVTLYIQILPQSSSPPPYNPPLESLPPAYNPKSV